jgi:hypothetical protein
MRMWWKEFATTPLACGISSLSWGYGDDLSGGGIEIDCGIARLDRPGCDERLPCLLEHGRVRRD